MGREWIGRAGHAGSTGRVVESTNLTLCGGAAASVDPGSLSQLLDHHGSETVDHACAGSLRQWEASDSGRPQTVAGGNAPLPSMGLKRGLTKGWAAQGRPRAAVGVVDCGTQRSR